MPIQGGFAYLCAVIDWHTRRVLAWELSNTLDATFCVQAVRRAMTEFGTPVRSSTPTRAASSPRRSSPNRSWPSARSSRWTARAAALITSQWRTGKYEEIYLKSYTSLIDAHAQLDAYFTFYNEQRPHSQLGRRPPAHVYRDLLHRKVA